MSVNTVYEYCPACLKRFRSIRSLLIHMESQHWRTNPLTCPDCAAEHYDPAALSRCKKRHQGMYKCHIPDCKFEGRSIGDIKTHATRKHGVSHLREDYILFSTSLARPQPPRKRNRSVFQPYRLLTKEKLTVESARIRAKKETRPARLLGSAVASHRAAAPDYPLSFSNRTYEGPTSVVAACSSIPPTTVRPPSHLPSPVTVRAPMDVSEIFLWQPPATLADIFPPATTAGLQPTPVPSSEYGQANSLDPLSAFWSAFTSMKDTPSGVGIEATGDWAVSQELAASCGVSSLFPHN